MTIGNLPKHIRRKPSRQGQVLLAYLPTAKLDHISNKSARRRTLANLFHACMNFILKPLEKAGIDGVWMTSGDGVVRRCHPIFATFVGDYPEQILVGALKTGQCPTCPVPRDKLGDRDSVGPTRELGEILEAFVAISQGPTEFTRACQEAGVKPIQHPFWENLPFLNIYQSIAPDVLHNLHQGVIKHLISWIRAICGDDEIDARCRRLPPNHNIRIFMKGISHLSRITGTEHEQISRILLGLIIDIRLPDNMSPGRLLRAVRGILDFLFLARYPVHTSETLVHLDAALKRFHDNKDIFIDLGVRANFNFPKIHFTGHYQRFIELFGTTDNYSTEYSERLHIDLAKDAYRATNMKDEYTQMTAWLERQEKVLQHDKYLRPQIHHLDPLRNPLRFSSVLIQPRELRMSKHPSARGVTIESLKSDYGALYFEDALARFVAQYQNPQLTKAQIKRAALNVHIPFRKLSVFHRVKYVSCDPYNLEKEENVVDSIHAQPARSDKYGNVIPGRFDTGLVNYKDGGMTGVKGHCVGRVRCVFILPSDALTRWFSHTGHVPPKYLAYVEWFTPFPTYPDQNHRLYKISKLQVHGEQQVSIIPVQLIRQSVHLFPKFGPVARDDWKSMNVLDLCNTFFTNPFSDRFPYSNLY